MRVQVVPLEFRAVLDRVFQTHDYEAAVLALGGGDVDPNSQMNVWLSSAATICGTSDSLIPRPPGRPRSTNSWRSNSPP